jgi:hypothetical protein
MVFDSRLVTFGRTGDIGTAMSELRASIHAGFNPGNADPSIYLAEPFITALYESIETEAYISRYESSFILLSMKNWLVLLLAEIFIPMCDCTYYVRIFLSSVRRVSLSIFYTFEYTYT